MGYNQKMFGLGSKRSIIREIFEYSKIRSAQMEKTPYMVILGDKDMENGTISVRHRSGEDLGAITLDAFKETLADVVGNKLKK